MAIKIAGNRVLDYDVLSYSNTNIAVGHQSLNSLTTGTNNTAVGYRSLYSSTTGVDNSAVGYQALYDIITGTDNTVIGYNTGRGITTGSKNTIIGANVTGLSATLANTIIIADGDGNNRIYVDSSGNVGIGTSSPSGKLDVVGGRSFFAAASEVYGIGVKYVSTGGSVYFGATSGSATPDAQISNAGGGALMTLQNGGNVGIGTTSPTQKLQVAGSCLLGDSVGVVTGDVAPTQIGTLTFGSNATSSYSWIQSYSSRNLSLNPVGNNVGIGTTSPRSILNTSVGTITGPAVTAGLTLSATYSGVTAVNSIDWNYIGQTSSPIRLGATFNSDGAGMDMVFYTSTSYTTNGSERMRLNKDGNLGIGTTPSYRFHVYNNTDAINSYFHLGKNNGGSADGVYILDDRGFAGVNSGKTFRVLTRNDGTNDTGAIASFENLTTTVLRVGIDGRVSIGTASPATSAALDITSTTGALIVPRMTTTQRDALTAVNGMIIYNTTTTTMQGYINGAWANM
jgi:hypothetical protein